ncbi:MAG: glycosyltransferase, partial [Bacteroidales bacterium]|nr:glycosyltransferase [Bacteroidales bacterium]
ASTDSSHAVYEKHKSDSRIRILKNDKNRGCGYTKRKCVENAKGDICGFVDADDIISSSALEKMIFQHNINLDHSIIYSTYYNCDQLLKPITVSDQVGQIEPTKYSWMNQHPMISHFATFKRAKYLQTSGITAWLQKAVDKDLYYKLEETGPVLFINEPLYYYRHHSHSISLNKNASLAYQFHLTIKAMIVLRAKERKLTLKIMPHSKAQLNGGMIIVGLSLLPTCYFLNGLGLLLKSLWFFNLQSLSYLPKLFMKYFSRRNQ